MAKIFKNTFDSPITVGTATYDVLKQIKVEFDTGQVLLRFDRYTADGEQVRLPPIAFTLTDAQLSIFAVQVMTVARNRELVPAGTDTETEV